MGSKTKILEASNQRQLKLEQNSNKSEEPKGYFSKDPHIRLDLRGFKYTVQLENTNGDEPSR